MSRTRTRTCSVLNCPNDSKNSPRNISFFSTVQAHLKAKWIAANTVGWKKSKSFFVCSDHFQKKDFYTGIDGKRRLKNHFQAIPSIFKQLTCMNSAAPGDLTSTSSVTNTAQVSTLIPGTTSGISVDNIYAPLGLASSSSVTTAPVSMSILGTASSTFVTNKHEDMNIVTTTLATESPTSTVTSTLTSMTSSRMSPRLLLTTANGVLLLRARCKNGFAGLLSNLMAMKTMFEEYVEQGPLDYFTAYKLSQDHVEHFFGSVRGNLGCNNNPTASQFKRSYKVLLLGGRGDANCDKFNVLLQSPQHEVVLHPNKHTAQEIELYEESADDINNYLIWSNLDEQNTTYSEYDQSVVEYVVGFVCKSLRVSCSCCFRFLLSSGDKSLKLISYKEKYCLTYPPPEAIKLCKLAEIELKRSLNLQMALQKDFFRSLSSKVLFQIVNQCENVFKTLTCDHKLGLIKTIVTKYIDIRLRKYAKLQNDEMKRNRMRKKLNKIVLFNHQ